MTVDEVVERRGITDILHFTTNQGLTGILASKAAKPRQRLPEDKRLEYICLYNCPDRSRDEAWHNYVNLTVTTVNLHLLGISQAHWHSGDENWWCILSFKPIILGHPGVYFATTNNIYTGVARDQGAVGLERLFADSVVRWQGNVARRTESTPMNQPTCNQAEVLYPGDLCTDYLEHVYVIDGDTACSAESIVDVFSGLPCIDVLVRPQFFR